MLLFDMKRIGDRLLTIRKKRGLTQAEVAERAGFSDRTYADAERGTVNLRVETLTRICDALQVTPDVLLLEKAETAFDIETIFKRLSRCSEEEQGTACAILDAYLKSLQK